MTRIGMTSESHYDHSESDSLIGFRLIIKTLDFLVLTSDLASLLAEEFRYNPIVDDEAAFDIHPQCVSLLLC